MSSLVQGARRLVGSGRTGPALAERLDALQTATDLARDRLDDALVERADGVIRRAGGRLALSGDHTIVALAGATGSGKSSTFNALSGVDLSQVSVRRPTTSLTTGVVWGEDDAVDVLDWLGVQRRHHIRTVGSSGSAAGGATAAGVAGAGLDLEGLVLLDLPDHDSTEVAHHLEVDRLVQLVDTLVWVLDPQKYADAALHERYLRPLATHRDVMIVVLNHIDEVPPGERRGMLADLRRLVDADGLVGVPLLATSARHGQGIVELRSVIAERVSAKKAAAARLAADVVAVASELQDANGTADPTPLGRETRNQLVDAFADAAGVPTVVRAVERSVAKRGSQHTGWLITSWLGRLRPDPLRRLHLDTGESGRELTRVARASVPEPTRVQRARVDTAVRAASDQVGSQLTPPWAAAVRRASVSRLPDLGDALDRAVVSTDLGVSRVPLWWRFSRLLQLLFALALIGGALWLGVLAVLGYLQLPRPSTPEQYGFPAPTLLLLLGLVGGLAVALVGRILNAVIARRRARAAERRLRGSIAEVTDELVVQPVNAELEAYAAARRAVDLTLR